MNRISAALACALVVGSAQAQISRSTRRVGFKDRFVVSCHPATGSTNTVHISAIDAPGTGTVPVQVKYPGAGIVFPNSASIAIVGQDFAGNGILQILVRDSAGAWSVHGTYTSAGSDFVGVAYSAATSRLYLLDGTKKQLVWSGYSVGDEPPTTWTVLANDTQAPVLASVSDGQMWLDGDGAEPTLYLRTESPMNLASWDTDLHTIKHTATGPVVGVLPGERHRAAFLTDDALTGLKSGATQLSVTGPPGAVAEALNVDDLLNPVVLGSATIDSNGVATITNLPAFPLGSVYGVRTNLLQQVVGPFASCVNKWGTPDSLGGSVSIRALPDLGLISYVGHSGFRVPILLDFDKNQVTVPTTYSATLVVGSAADPVIDADPPNGRWVLLGSSTFTTTATIFNDALPGFGQVELPIPDDQNLANAEVRYQWWVTLSPTDIRISDVQGAAIRGSIWVPPGAEAFFGVGGPASASSKDTSKRPKRKVWRRRAIDQGVARRVVMKWLSGFKSRKTVAWQDENIKAKLLEAIRAGIRRR